MAAEMDVPFLGGIPIDPRIARAADEGEAFLQKFRESRAAVAYLAIVDRIRAFLVAGNNV